MRTIVLSILAVAISSVNLLAVPAPTDSKPAEPTEEQLAAAKEAYAKIGADCLVTADSQTKRTIPWFVMPQKTTDADLTRLPNLSFRFALSLDQTKVTDAGM